MSIDITIRQKLFGRRSMPLDVILGDQLHYGNFENDQLTVGELGEGEFVAYDPEHIGRGFSVIWNPNETRAVHLRLPHPSTKAELQVFYDTVARMVRHWDGKLTVDGSRIRLGDFLSSFDDMVSFNDSVIRQFSQQVLDGAHDTLTLYSAMWPLAVGPEEAAVFLDDPDAYAAWLHEKQDIDVYFAVPSFYSSDAGIFGRYCLTSSLPAVFPHQPAVPFGVDDPATGKPLECSKWVIRLMAAGTDELLKEMDYTEFLHLIPEDKMTRYDGARFLLPPMTEEDLRTLFCQ